MDDQELSMEDVERLLADRSADSRSLLAQRLGTSYATGRLSEREREIADDIVRAVARDVEMRVRAALARSIRMSPRLPRDVALRLANDVAAVAVPILEASAVLSDEDLIAVVRSRGSDHRVAIARRNSLSEPVGSAIVDSGDVPAVAQLVANEGASLGDGTLARIVDDYADNQSVVDILSERSALPLRIAERLVTLVTSELHRKLGDQGGSFDVLGPDHEATELLLLDPEGALLDLAELLWRLIDEDRVGPDLIAKAASIGDRGLVEVGLSRLAGLSIGEVRRRVDSHGIDALLASAGIVAEDRPVISAFLKDRRATQRISLTPASPDIITG